MTQAKRHRRRAGRRSRWNRRRRRVAILVGAAIVAALVVATLPLLLTRGSAGPSGPRAAVVDQLGLTQPNPAFVQAATSILEEAGYTVDYYPGEQVTVDFYRNLPSLGHKLVVLRIHSGPSTKGDYLGLFTAEPYVETEHAAELGQRHLGSGRYYEGGPAYFAIGPDFVRSTMQGRFKDSIVIMMGCYGMSYERPTLDFIGKGAKAVIGWDGTVSAEHTDEATEHLLRHLVIDKLDAVEAAARTMNEVGPDPSYGSELLVYPPEAAASTVR